jgi:hypothetical protein
MSISERGMGGLLTLKNTHVDLNQIAAAQGRLQIKNRRLHISLGMPPVWKTLDSRTVSPNDQKRGESHD